MELEISRDTGSWRSHYLWMPKFMSRSGTARFCSSRDWIVGGKSERPEGGSLGSSELECRPRRKSVPASESMIGSAFFLPFSGGDSNGNLSAKRPRQMTFSMTFT